MLIKKYTKKKINTNLDSIFSKTLYLKDSTRINHSTFSTCKYTCIHLFFQCLILLNACHNSFNNNNNKNQEKWFRFVFLHVHAFFIFLSLPFSKWTCIESIMVVLYYLYIKSGIETGFNFEGNLKKKMIFFYNFKHFVQKCVFVSYIFPSHMFCLELTF